MIDFRYHLVSIVSIFLALAVGIVLGAGPLKEDLGNTLTSEVKNLRTDKAVLRTELDAADRGIRARDDFTEASNRSLLAGRLTDTTISVVVLPGADQGVVKSTSATLAGAGARIGSTVTLQDAWVEPDKAAFRATLASQLASGVGVPVDEGGGELINAVLARSVLTKAGSSAQGARTTLESLRTGELVKYSGTVVPSSVAVVVGGPVNGSTADDRTTRAAALAKLVGALDDAGAGAVLVTPTVDPRATGATSVVTTARSDGDLAKQVSTVDDVDLPMGQASVVFGLLEQEAGRAGQYGLAPDAAAAFPQLATK